MADEKKYTAQEAAAAVLQKAQEMLKNRLAKNDGPKGEIHPKEHMEGESENPGKRIESQPAPEHNPAEERENNNPMWGDAPGVHKLSMWVGRMHDKKSKKAAAMKNDPEMEKAEQLHKELSK